MPAPSIFGTSQTHGVLQQVGAQVSASSEGLGWTSAYASTQREQPYEANFPALSDSLMVLHRGGPVDLVYNTGRQSISRHIPKGGVFFLPAGQECRIHLRGLLDTTHIYLRSELFGDGGPATSLAGLAPLFGERDPVLEHLAGAVGTILAEAAPSLAVDPIAKALAGRFIDLNFRTPSTGPSRRSYQLTNRQLRRVLDFIETHIEADIRLDALAALCGVSPDYFLRTFKATAGVSPYQYVLNRRVERAKRLLAEDAAASLAEVAVRCGFAHQEHLSRMFRRFTGVTPGQYRRASS
ncbi:AraC family transcriptional regulator [Reyranella sp. CPCC 100927]|uniref:AraC family transcriptional regulator n=1 Tax=Reyranella sp. CPCC 100927 TaxID=2599616 RepID=UPI0011B82232|nr:AraC family transcriptional regulator [Reyranella sp. CPCC 100927]TWT15294.1 helix-turn-helix transcriptional regulator [Reyranella sp. CPCC 100927]